MSESDDFEWSEATNVVIRSVDAIAVYRNREGDIVIRQQSRLGEEDPYIVVPESLVSEILRALQNEISPPASPPTFQTTVRR